MIKNVTLLKLRLHFQVSFQQIENDGLHVTPNSTAVPGQDTFQPVSINAITVLFCMLFPGRKLTSVPAEQYSECSWRTPLCQPSSAAWLRGCLEHLQSGIKEGKHHRLCIEHTNSMDLKQHVCSGASLTLWLGNWQRTEVMLLAYWAMTFRISFSTPGGIRPATLVMISWSSNSGREGSLNVFIRVATHCFSCGHEHAHIVNETDDII